MVNKNKLMSFAVANGLNQRTLSILIRNSENTFSKKINGKIPFSTDEVIRICEECKINDIQDKVDIFLCQVSQKWDKSV